MKKVIQHEITLLAFSQDGSDVVIHDIVETSNKNASFFTRRWLRDPAIIGIGTTDPNWPGHVNYRDLRRVCQHGDACGGLCNNCELVAA